MWGFGEGTQSREGTTDVASGVGMERAFGLEEALD